MPTNMTRRDLLHGLTAASMVASTSAAQASEATPIPVGIKRQLFIDELWLDKQENIRLTRHTPEAREPVLVGDRPWEKNAIRAYTCVLKDGDRFRMWYRLYPVTPTGRYTDERRGPRLTCYAESKDGIHWEKPDLGIVEWQGSRRNNILFPPGDIQGTNACVIIDPNAGVQERYKMITRTRQVWGYVSPDGLRWKPVPANPLIDDPPADSHNVLLWDDERQRYVIYMRGVDPSVSGPFKGGRRSIRRSESQDFRNWSKPELVLTADHRDPVDFHLYTNAAVKYDRAERAYFAFPMVLHLKRQWLGAPNPGLSEVIFATSRDGIRWERRFRHPFLKPGLDELNWVDRNPILSPGIIQTGPGELSMYYSEYWRSPQSRVRRAVLRADGFVSVEGPYEGWGEFTTPPVVHSGCRLELNYSTSGGGGMFVELQDHTGKPLHGYTLGDCPEIFGNKIEGVVSWKQGNDLARTAGKRVRIRVRLRDAHLYAFRFIA